MPQESRLKKSLLNARVNLIFYFLSLALSFFSRKIFLDALGADFMGLIGTLNNLLGFLNLAELGISTAIGYVLYKPLFEHDEKKINKIAGHRAFFMADANQYVADEVQPDLLKMEYSIKMEFDKCRIENSALLAKVELTRCMAELACLSLDIRIEEVRPYNKEVTGITYLRLTDTLKVLDELSDILYKGGYCDLNQSDNCKRGMAIIQRKLTDCDIISRAINESDKLNPAGDDE